MLSGVHFKAALFVPNTSVYYKVGTALPTDDAQVDVSWQMTLQKVWESLIVREKGTDAPWVVFAIVMLIKYKIRNMSTIE